MLTKQPQNVKYAYQTTPECKIFLPNNPGYVVKCQRAEHIPMQWDSVRKISNLTFQNNENEMPGYRGAKRVAGWIFFQYTFYIDLKKFVHKTNVAPGANVIFFLKPYSGLPNIVWRTWEK